MVNNLGQSTEKKDVVSLNVTDPVQPILIPRFSNIKIVTGTGRAVFTFQVIDAPSDLDKFKIAYGESADSLSQEVMTYSTGKIQ